MAKKAVVQFGLSLYHDDAPLTGKVCSRFTLFAIGNSTIPQPLVDRIVAAGEHSCDIGNWEMLHESLPTSEQWQLLLDQGLFAVAGLVFIGCIYRFMKEDVAGHENHNNVAPRV